MAYFQLPGSTRVLYRVEDIGKLEAEFTHPGKGVEKKANRSEIKKAKPGASSTEREWRI
jgi:hypothetical protein